MLIHADGNQNGVRIVVSDNGPGIEAKLQPRIFDTFSRFDGRLTGVPAALACRRSASSSRRTGGA